MMPITVLLSPMSTALAIIGRSCDALSDLAIATTDIIYELIMIRRVLGRARDKTC